MSFELKLSRLDEIAQINPKRRVTKGVQVPFVEMAALPQNSRDIQRSDVEVRVAKSAGAHFKNGDTLLARITPCLENGKTAQVNCLDAELVGEGSTEFIVLCGIDPKDDDYIYYLCRDPEFRKYAIGRMEGTSGRQRVSWQSIAAYEFQHIPPNERRASAKALAAMDNRITLLRETNATLEAIAQALFKSWFVDFDPVRAKSEGKLPDGMDVSTAALFPDAFDEAELGLLPKGWQVEALDDVAEFLNGLALQKFPPTGVNDLPVIKIAQLRKGDTAGADLASGLIKPEYVIQNGDVLFSWSGSLEVEIWCGGVGALNQHLFKVSSSRFDKWFYYLWTKHHLESFRQIAASKATTMGHIQRGHLSSAKVNVPNESVLKVANALFTPLVERIVHNALQANTLANLRDTLLPRLISGQVRITDAEAELEKVTA
ncbi:MAG: restriction endonuclease subunit S [Burkholderiales bacterium 35-55-47]|jgi:type I restriction enzyme S subunit|uniref:restriction endonuclease subunit S n=1 Tax=Limnohabitans sp. TaxID=1907725 RepID=UPI000BC3E1B4|nr:restriction endonuclease subunit S [Limnohabitans sp.]OYY19596.1 MAG: restriction endonuclease subunit S [Burkholderiales bacterium 35-55-47]OYZ74793.1 MAG: restriction endonuclease subunit S [Burkholderiales bacterium 24-55-52]OZB01319.1 MAG: restriction endonuclease subunit S [Burkholderiales bacterium 39-55-53]HQR85777.1 restriction endonuclease subunit S [Limnohabitans sp.]HQS26307.1 restriction endonuclease subunit S [Limnohabitans sp.]